MEPSPTINELVQLLQGAGTPLSGIVVFLLYRLNREIADLKVELKTYAEVMEKFVAKSDK